MINNPNIIVSGFMAIAGAVLVAVFCAADTARASTQVYFPEYGNGTPMPGTVSFQGGMVAGSIFKATSTVTFNSLGFIDLNVDPSNPTSGDLLGSYQVGIWDASTEQLLASTTVTPDSTLIGVFRYSPIPATTISAGESFVIGALLPENLQDGYMTDMIDVLSPDFSGAGFGISLVGATTLSFPTGNTYIGSAAVAIVNASDAIVSPVPEPSTTTMLVSLGCLAMLWRRRTATATN